MRPYSLSRRGTGLPGPAPHTPGPSRAPGCSFLQVFLIYLGLTTSKNVISAGAIGSDPTPPGHPRVAPASRSPAQS